MSMTFYNLYNFQEKAILSRSHCMYDRKIVFEKDGLATVKVEASRLKIRPMIIT